MFNFNLMNDSRYYNDAPIHSDYYADMIVAFGSFMLLGRKMDFLLRFTVNNVSGKQKFGNTCFALLDESRNEYSENFHGYTGDRIITDNKKLFARTSEMEIGVNHEGLYIYAEMEPITVRFTFGKGDCFAAACNDGKFELGEILVESYSYPKSDFKGNIFIAGNSYDVGGHAFYTRVFQKRSEGSSAGKTGLLRIFQKDKKKAETQMMKGFMQAVLINGNHINMWFGKMDEVTRVWAQAINPYDNRTELMVPSAVDGITDFLERRKSDPKARLKVNFLEPGNENHFSVNFMPLERKLGSGITDEDSVEFYEGIARVKSGNEVIGICYVNVREEMTEA